MALNVIRQMCLVINRFWIESLDRRWLIEKLKIHDSFRLWPQNQNKIMFAIRTHTELACIIPLDHQINHRFPIQLIMIAVELDVRVHAGTVVLRVFIVLVDVGHLSNRKLQSISLNFSSIFIHPINENHFEEWKVVRQIKFKLWKIIPREVPQKEVEWNICKVVSQLQRMRMLSQWGKP